MDKGVGELKDRDQQFTQCEYNIFIVPQNIFIVLSLFHKKSSFRKFLMTLLDVIWFAPPPPPPIKNPGYAYVMHCSTLIMINKRQLLIKQELICIP